jgi:hypothetical protein
MDLSLLAPSHPLLAPAWLTCGVAVALVEEVAVRGPVSPTPSLTASRSSTKQTSTSWCPPELHPPPLFVTSYLPAMGSCYRGMRSVTRIVQTHRGIRGWAVGKALGGGDVKG